MYGLIDTIVIQVDNVHLNRYNRSMSYSVDYRKRVLSYLGEGHTLENTKTVFKVSISTIRSWKKQLVETGNLQNKPLTRTFRKIDPEKLLTYISEHPDHYLREIAEVFSCSDEAVRQALAKHKITRKKRQKSTVSAMKRNEKSLSEP